MVKHIILWTLKDMTNEEKLKVKKEIKVGLESLKGKIAGLTDIEVVIDGKLETSTADLMLNSTFKSVDALKQYSVHPTHVAIANSKVRPFVSNRTCLDFEVL